MDDEFNHWKRLVARLRQFPKTERQHRLRYANQLRTGMIDRTGLMYGGLQKLGPFPVLIALYLQFRNWKWGNWAGAFDVSLVAGLLILSLVLLYGRLDVDRNAYPAGYLREPSRSLCARVSRNQERLIIGGGK